MSNDRIANDLDRALTLLDRAMNPNHHVTELRPLGQLIPFNNRTTTAATRPDLGAGSGRLQEVPE